MESNKTKYIKDLLNSEDDHLKKLNEIVSQAVEQEKILMQNISSPGTDKLTYGERLSDRVAKFGGSWSFIIIFCFMLFIWILINQFLPDNKRFDPYPYILMNLVLSCIAALQAPIIMMSQNRQEAKDRERNENDYMVNLKAEIEIRTLHQKMDLLIQEQFKKLMETQAEQIKLLQNIIKDDKTKDKS